MGRFVEELRQRRVWRVVIAYPGIAFVILEAVEFFIDNYGLDTACVRVTVNITGENERCRSALAARCQDRR